MNGAVECVSHPFRRIASVGVCQSCRKRIVTRCDLTARGIEISVEANVEQTVVDRQAGVGIAKLLNGSERIYALTEYWVVGGIIYSTTVRKMRDHICDC